MPARLRLADLLAGLSIAADLGFALPTEQAMRSCLVATALARRMGLGEEEAGEAFYTALLVHVGCSALSYETAAAFGDDRVVMGAVATTNVADPEEVAGTLMPELARRLGPARRGLLEQHAGDAGREFGRRFDTGSCEVASATARRVGLGAPVQRALREAVEWWNGEGPPRGLRGEEIARPARIVRAAADAALFDHLGGPDAAVDALRRRSGTLLDPAVVEAFAAGAGEILAEVHAGDPRTLVVEAEPAPVREIHEDELPRVATAFGDLADLKTPWTHGHSAAGARLAVAAAERLGLDRATVAAIQVAAPLRDLGRVAISNAIWEKPAALTRAESEQVRMHAYHSERILATSRTLEPLARLAGAHHERLDGSGYHRGCRARELSPAERLLAAADTLAAMTADRPHRGALTLDEAAAAVRDEVRAGRLDGDVAGALLEVAGAGAPRRRDNLRPAGLTEREVEVARLVAAGRSNPEIAERLVISRRTAEHHVQNIYGKVGVASRAALALFVHEHGLLAAEDR